MKNRRVILDTNLWISFLISKRQEELDLLLESGDSDMLVLGKIENTQIVSWAEFISLE
jgi:predicted nucleic acid-binding protein